MKLLLDTHTIIWYTEEHPRLPSRIRQMLKDDSNDIYVSMASLWEMAIKVSLGKLNLTRSLPDVAQSMHDNYFQFLGIHLDHIYCLKTLPHHHKDPFDRMLAAQSLAESMPLVSCDDVFDHYGIRRLWQAPSKM